MKKESKLYQKEQKIKKEIEENEQYLKNLKIMYERGEVKDELYEKIKNRYENKIKRLEEQIKDLKQPVTKESPSTAKKVGFVVVLIIGIILCSYLLWGYLTPVSTTSTPTPPTTTPIPTTTPPPTTTPAPTEPKGGRIDRTELELGTRLSYLFTIGGNEWGCTISYKKRFEEERIPWFRWGVTDYWNPHPEDTHWRYNYIYSYSSGGVLKEVYYLDTSWGYMSSGVYLYKIKYAPHVSSVFPLVKGAKKINTGKFDLEILGEGIRYGSKAPQGIGTYERRIYVEGFEDIEAGGKTYRCARVKYYMKHSIIFLSPYDNEDWGKTEWIEEGYHWYSDIGLVKKEVTIKTYWWGELEKTDKVSITLTGVTMP